MRFTYVDAGVNLRSNGCDTTNLCWVIFGRIDQAEMLPRTRPAQRRFGGIHLCIRLAPGHFWP